MQEKIQSTDLVYEKHTMELEYQGQPFKIQYNSIGQGPLMLYIHGWGHSKEIWSPILPLLYQQFPNNTHIALDLPGFGHSTTPRNFDHQLPHYAEILHDFITKIDLSENFICGHSMGGLITLLYLKKYTSNFRTVAICGSPLEGLPSLRRLFYIPGLAFLAMAMRCLIPTFVFRHGPLITIARENISKIPDDFWDSMRIANTHTMVECLRQIAFFPADTFLDCEIKQQILLVRGEYETILNQQTAKKFHEIFLAKLVTLPKVSHTYTMESPVEFEQILSEFARDSYKFFPK